MRRRMFTAHASPWRLRPRRAAGGSELWHRIQSLPSRQRAVVVLCHYEGLTEAEAGDVLGIREQAARTLLLRARTALGVETAA